MAALRTIPAALERAAARVGAGLTFVEAGATEAAEETLTFAALHERARAIAVALCERGMRKGDRVALVLPASAEFVPTFVGVIAGGGVPVPLYPPLGLGQLGNYLEHSRHIVSASRSRLLVTNSAVRAALGTLHESCPELGAMLVYDDLSGDPALYRDPGLGLDDLCFIQFTSGSTARPKGVMVTHGNLAHNCNAIMRDALATTETDRGVSWLPLFHDMGLIGFVLAPIHHVVPVTLLSPVAFLKRPAIWLEYLSRHRGTITYAPNFAYAITTKRVRDSELEGLDLASVRIAGCGAEPIQAETLRAFVRRFSRHGFREQALVPSYGMAEATLGIAFSRGIPTDRVRTAPLWNDASAVAATPTDEDAVEIIGCGPAFPGHRIRIVDIETRTEMSERRVGEIEVSGPSVTPGYFEDPERTVETFSRDGWLRTGDLGYLAGGQIFICGRAKDVLIVNGKNYYPQDLEWAATSVEGVRAGNVIAFPVHRAGAGSEAVVVVAESRAKEGRDEIGARIKAEIHRQIGLMVDEVVVADTGTIPKTSSGKLQRAKARTLWEAGALRPRTDEGAVTIAGRLVQSQLAHLKLSIFGDRRAADPGSNAE